MNEYIKKAYITIRPVCVGGSAKTWYYFKDGTETINVSSQDNLYRTMTKIVDHYNKDGIAVAFIP